jgi:Peptidase family M28
MKKIHYSRNIFLIITLFLLVQLKGKSQGQPANPVDEKEVATILETLSADELKGRQAFSPEIHIAAGYIAGAFEKYKLKVMPGNDGYLQNFSMVQATAAEGSKVMIGEEMVPASRMICQTDQKTLKISPQSGFEVVRINEGENPMAAFRSVRGKKANLLILMHSSQEPFFNRVKENAGPKMKDGFSTIFVMTGNTKAETFDLDLKLDVKEVKMSNVVGMLPGKSRPDEYVIFSSHYDHIGVGKPDDKGDSIFNGANDDASGTTAVMMLAKHFAAEGNNERTLVFATFTAEEVGGYGSQYFSKQLDPAKVMAMFNIEMIGTESKWGTNSAYITGFEKSNMGEILQKNLKGSPFQFHPDPYPQQQLFYRSDNATLARLGVPAHTISTSKMDSEPHYHRQSDERSTLDTRNMAEIIKAIAISSKSIAAGTDTPTRVDTTQLR